MDNFPSLRKDIVKSKELKRNAHLLVISYLKEAGINYYFDLANRLHFDLGTETYLIKPVHRSNVKNFSFIITEPLTGFFLMGSPEFFEVEGALFQKIKIDFDFSRPGNKLEAFDVVHSVYKSSGKFKMLKPLLEHEDLITNHESSINFDSVEDFLNVPALRFQNLFNFLSEKVGLERDVKLKDISTGFVHEDLSRENILCKENLRMLTDLDPISYSYAFLNIVYFYILSCEGEESEVLKKQLILRIKEVALQDEFNNFNYFLSLALYRLLIKRVFHIDYYSSSWEDGIVTHFQDLYKKLKI